tara:strand:+ start:680 stop:1006 length:327 start_codon:yes stop_codon:yes gene_type:complete
MKLTKETLKRIIKEEMMQVMHEMDSNLGPMQAELKSLLAGDLEGMVNFEFSTKDGDDGASPVMVVDATTQSGSDTDIEIAEINGQLIVNGNVEGDGSAKAAAAYLLNL